MTVGGTHDSKTNYIDKTKLTKNAYININGTETSYDGFYATDYTELAQDTHYYCGNLFSGYYAYYDENKNLIEGHKADYTLVNPITIPIGAKYGRFTCISSALIDKIWIHTENSKPDDYALTTKCLSDDIKIKSENIIGESIDENPCDYNGEEITTFSNGICIGDSLTAGTFNYYATHDGVTNNTNFVEYDKYSFPRNLERISGISITNLGTPGATSEEWFNIHKTDDVSGYDFAIIQLGVNDGIRYNGWTERSTTAFTNVINMLKSANNNIFIFVATIIPAISYSYDIYNTVSDGIRSYVNGLNDDHVILLDMALYGHTKDENAYNCGHLSAFGYNRLARDYKGYISWHMNKNKMLYQQIQHIGTDKYYKN